MNERCDGTPAGCPMYNHLQAEIKNLTAALHAAISRPMGVAPNIAAPYYNPWHGELNTHNALDRNNQEADK